MTRTTSRWAVLRLVLAVLFWPLGVVFSVLGLRETGDRGPRAGRGLAIAGLAVSAVAFVITVVLVVLVGAALVVGHSRGRSVTAAPASTSAC